MKKITEFTHPFHLVTLSPWPLLTSFSVLMMTFGFIFLFNFNQSHWMFLGMMLVILMIYQWWRDIIRESTYQGFHTIKVQEGLKLGMILFIISELFFFISIFWCYIHMFLSPSIEIGGGAFWPPKNILFFNPYQIPLINTIILLSSGVSITWCHHSLIHEKLNKSLLGLIITILLGIFFSGVQYLEYKEATFTIADSVYGSIFFMATGFHGLHVIIGTMFLSISLIRMTKNHFSSDHHIGLEMAIWYWHFVDVVWLFLYLLVYFFP
nr:cytochrome c oxidase subunit III [Kradibia gibbosae]